MFPIYCSHICFCQHNIANQFAKPNAEAQGHIKNKSITHVEIRVRLRQRPCQTRTPPSAQQTTSNLRHHVASLWRMRCANFPPSARHRSPGAGNPPWSGPNAHPMEDCCSANKTNEKTNPILEHRQGVVVVLNTHGSACLCVLLEMPCGQTSAFTKHSLFPGAE